MKSKILSLFHFKNDIYGSYKISLEEIKKMCDDSNCPYFKLFIMKNKYKEDNDDSKPDYIFWIKTDILNNRKK